MQSVMDHEQVCLLQLPVYKIYNISFSCLTPFTISDEEGLSSGKNKKKKKYNHQFKVTLPEINVLKKSVAVLVISIITSP